MVAPSSPAPRTSLFDEDGTYYSGSAPPTAATRSDHPRAPPTSYVLAVELNDAGADMIDAGDFDLAVRMLRDTLEVLSRPPEPSKDASSCSTDQIAGAIEVYRRKGASRAATRLPSVRAVDPQIYERPLKLGPIDNEVLQNCPDSCFSLEEISSVVLYNLALAHHLPGDITDSRGHVERAVRFYGMAETMLLKAFDARANPPESEFPARWRFFEWDVLVKATLNNAGQIGLAWGYPSLARAYFDKLNTLCANEHGSGMDVFAFNTFVARGMNSAPAA